MPEAMTIALLAHDDEFGRYVVRLPLRDQVQGPYFGNFDEVHLRVVQALDAAYGAGTWELVYEDHPWQFVSAGEAVSRAGAAGRADVGVDGSGTWHGRIPGAPFFREDSFPALQRAIERVTGTASWNYYFVDFRQLEYV